MSDKQPDPITPSRQDHLGELFSALQRLLPQHTLSRLLGKLADHRHPRLKHFLIQSAMARYGIELEEAALQQPEDYPSFNDFFTRRLRDGARPIDPSPNALVSPADGTVSQLGTQTRTGVQRAVAARRGRYTWTSGVELGPIGDPGAIADRMMPGLGLA